MCYCWRWQWYLYEPTGLSAKGRSSDQPVRQQFRCLLRLWVQYLLQLFRLLLKCWLSKLNNENCVVMVTCGQNSQENGTYFVNKGFPGSFNGTGSCQLSITKMSPDICQYRYYQLSHWVLYLALVSSVHITVTHRLLVRFDFDQFSIAGPEPDNHICNYDQFIISGTNPIPGICGFNTGNHGVYFVRGSTWWWVLIAVISKL